MFIPCWNSLYYFTSRQIEQILGDKSEALPGEERVAALTAGDRTHWANARMKLFSKGPNKVNNHCKL